MLTLVEYIPAVCKQIEADFTSTTFSVHPYCICESVFYYIPGATGTLGANPVEGNFIESHRICVRVRTFVFAFVHFCHLTPVLVCLFLLHIAVRQKNGIDKLRNTF